MTGRPTLAIVVPALDAATTLPATLAALADACAAFDADLVVVDGGSHDETPEVARRAGARVIAAPRGRGVQLAAGAAAAMGDWLLFVHADTVLEHGWHEVARDFVATARARAGWFRFALDDASRAARRLERIVDWRCRTLALPYGDQGLLLPRALYDAAGGYRPLPLMEDVDLVRRLGRRRLAALDARAVTSAARYRHDGYLRRGARNLACFALWRLGVPTGVITRLYG